MNYQEMCARMVALFEDIKDEYGNDYVTSKKQAFALRDLLPELCNFAEQHEAECINIGANVEGGDLHFDIVFHGLELHHGATDPFFRLIEKFDVVEFYKEECEKNDEIAVSLLLQNFWGKADI